MSCLQETTGRSCRQNKPDCVLQILRGRHDSTQGLMISSFKSLVSTNGECVKTSARDIEVGVTV